MKTMRLFSLELRRLLQSRLTWLVIFLTVLSPVLGLVLYKPFAKAKASFPWSKRRESNPREPAWEAGAIPIGDSCVVIIILYSAVFCNRNAYPIKKFLKKIFALSPKDELSN